MTRLKWWMRIVGVFYLLQFVMMTFVRAPIRAFGPKAQRLRLRAHVDLALTR